MSETGDPTTEQKEEKKPESSTANFDDFLRSLDEELAPEPAEEAPIQPPPGIDQSESTPNATEGEGTTESGEVGDVLCQLISETRLYGRTKRPSICVSPAEGSCEATEGTGSASENASSHIESDPSPRPEESHWESRRQPLKPIVLTPPPPGGSPQPSPTTSPSPSGKTKKHHRFSNIFKRSHSTSGPEGEAIAVAARNTVMLSGMPQSAQSEGTITLGTARQRAISDTPRQQKKLVMSSVVVRPIQTEFRPWMEEYGVDPEVANILVEKGCNLASLRTITENELISYGIQSTMKRL